MLLFIFAILLGNAQKAFAVEFTAQAIYLTEGVQTSKTIKTCWLNPEADRIIQSESAMKIAQDIITNEYLRAGVEVSGWLPCNQISDPADITKILIADTQPRVIDIGCVDKTAPWCIRLNFDFLKWPGIDTACQVYSWDLAWACNCHQDSYAKACVQNYALHEFGHSLGLAHEADHSQSTCQDKTGTWGAQEPFPYNSLSIMNYCQNKDQVLNKLTPSLSDVDVKTLLFLQTLNTYNPMTPR